MSEKDNYCKHPEKLKGTPGECSPEQIEDCHGKEKDSNCSCQGGIKVIDCTCPDDSKKG